MPDIPSEEALEKWRPFTELYGLIVAGLAVFAIVVFGGGWDAHSALWVAPAFTLTGSFLLLVVTFLVPQYLERGHKLEQIGFASACAIGGLTLPFAFLASYFTNGAVTASCFLIAAFLCAAVFKFTEQETTEALEAS